MNSNGRFRRLGVVAGSESLISSAGGSLLLRTAQVSGFSAAMTEQLRRWRSPRARHDPGKAVLDLAVAIALGGDCLADVAVLHSQPRLFGAVASKPTVSRLIATLAADAPAADASAALTALRTARAAAREQAWALRPPVADDGPVVIDLDATMVLAHSQKEGAPPTWERTFRLHPALASLDDGPGGTG